MLSFQMSRYPRTVFVALLIHAGLFSGHVYGSEDLTDYASTHPKGFLQEYCLNCHGEEKQKGDRRFDHLDLNFDNEDTAFEWQEILDMVNLGEMPPEDEEQP